MNFLSVFLICVGLFLAPSSFCQTAQALLNQGTQQAAAGNHSAAILSFSLAIRQSRTNAHCWYSRGCSRIATNDYEGALADLSQAITLDSLYYDAYIWKARIHYCRFMEHEKMVAVLAAAAAQFPDSALLHCYLGQFSRNQTQALTAYANAIRLQPNNGEFYYHRARYLQFLNPQNSLADFDSAIVREPYNLYYYNARYGLNKQGLGFVNMYPYFTEADINREPTPPENRPLVERQPISVFRCEGITIPY